MEKRRKEYFDHALDRALDRAAMILDDLRFIRKMRREDQDETVYTYTLGMVEAVENMTRNARELVLSQRTPTGEEDVKRIVDENYKIEMGFTKEEWFCLRMPLIIPKKNGYSVKYVENRLRAALKEFWKYRPHLSFPYDKAVIVFHHMYARSRNAWERCVPADSEVECVIRLIFVYVLHQMFQVTFRHYHCCSLGEEECTEVYVMPISDFDKWLAQETPYLLMTPKRGKLYECPADARKARNKEDSEETASM